MHSTLTREQKIRTLCAFSGMLDMQALDEIPPTRELGEWVFCQFVEWAQAMNVPDDLAQLEYVERICAAIDS